MWPVFEIVATGCDPCLLRVWTRLGLQDCSLLHWILLLELFEQVDTLHDFSSLCAHFPFLLLGSDSEILPMEKQKLFVEDMRRSGGQP